MANIQIFWNIFWVFIKVLLKFSQPGACFEFYLASCEFVKNIFVRNTIIYMDKRVALFGIIPQYESRGTCK